MLSYKTYWKFIENPKRIIRELFQKEDNRYSIIRTSKKLKGEMVLYGDYVYRLLGWQESPEDYYWVLLNGNGKIELASCLSYIVRLRGRIKTWNYLYLDYVWGVNNKTLEKGLELANETGIEVL